MIWLALKLAESWEFMNWGSVPFGGPFCTNHGIVSKEIDERLCSFLKKKKNGDRGIMQNTKPFWVPLGR